MFSKLIKLIFASSLIAALFGQSKKQEDYVSEPSEAFEKATTQSNQNRQSVEVSQEDNQTADSDQGEPEPFIQSPG